MTSLTFLDRIYGSLISMCFRWASLSESTNKTLFHRFRYTLNGISKPGVNPKSQGQGLGVPGSGLRGRNYAQTLSLEMVIVNLISVGAVPVV
jgi:hypothetical protein